MGLITNFLAIIIGGILGLTIGKKFNEDIIDRFNEFKEFYNKLVKNNLALYIYIS